MVDTKSDNRHWYDGLGSMFSGVGGAMGRGAKSAQAGIAGSDAAQGFGKTSGLSPYMKMFGMGAADDNSAGERMAKPSELRDLAGGKTPASPGVGMGGLWDHITGGGTTWGSKVTGQKESNGFEKIKNDDGSSGGYKAPSYQNWSAVGRSGGNRQSDIDNRDKSVPVGLMKDNGNAEEGNQTVSAPEIYQPDLSKLYDKHKVTDGQKSIRDAKEIKGADGKGTGKYENNTGAGTFTDRTSGTASGGEFGLKTQIDPLTGKGLTTLANAYAVAGGEYKTGVRAGAMSDDKRYMADAEAGFVASGGASGQIGIDTKNGLYATGGVGGKVGGYAQANADAKTESTKIGGVDYDAGIGAHAEVFAGAKAGMGATVGLGPDFIGAKGNIGAFVGAEAAADVHGNLGPLAGKVGASGMAGAGIGADGDVSFKDGKFHIGGKMFAALGYGGSLSADMTVDVGAMGKSAYNLGATGLDYAGKGINAGLDYAGKAGNAIGAGATNMYNGAAQGLSNAGTAIGNTATNMYNGAATGLSNAGNAIGNTASNMYNGASQGISNAGSAISNGASRLFSW